MSGEQSHEDRTTKFGAFAIICAFVCPPAGVIWATRCWRESGKHRETRAMAYVAAGFVLFGLVAYSAAFAVLTRNFPLNIDI
jgi:hypothetical protein